MWKTAAAVCALMLAPGAALAQEAGDIGRVLATVQEGFGQSVGEGVLGGQSIFVTAHGRVPLPAGAAQPQQAVKFEVQAKAPTAVAAATELQARLDRAGAVARRYGVRMFPGETNFALMFPSVEGEDAEDGDDEPGPQKLFHATTEVEIEKPAAAQVAPMMDALRAAGIEEFQGSSLFSKRGGLFGGTMEVLGFGSSDAVDEAVWARASQAAISAARAQADVLAKAAGRRLGPARQIMVLARSADEKTAVVTVSVRFGFAED